MIRSPRCLPALALSLGFLFVSAATTRAGEVQAPATAARGDFAVRQHLSR